MLLHDHLDGGLRPQTVIELASRMGHVLPETEPGRLAAWFDQRDSGSLEKYLESFTHTVGVLQDAGALRRAAREAAADLAADNVVYGEIRFAPSLHKNVTPAAAIAAVAEGLREGSAGTYFEFGLIVVAMREQDDSETVASAAIRMRDLGVVGFDLAGPERGFPPTDHIRACQKALEGGLGLTIHAGEAAGVDSIRLAVECGAQRLGHGVEIIEDCRIEDDVIVDLGSTAQVVHERQIPLEVCPWSNLATKQWSPAQHPIGMLHRAGFIITVNTDNRLMSRTSMTKEMELCVSHQGFSTTDLRTVTLQEIEAAFCPEDVKQRLAARLDPS